ncbi:MAG: hypothetical protein WBM24_16765 [Candidatus Sulfotelmatobacter sp.]
MKKTPKVGDVVAIEGSLGTYVVARVDGNNKTVAVKNTKDASVLLTDIPASRITPLDESQNALRVVREATDD